MRKRHAQMFLRVPHPPAGVVSHASCAKIMLPHTKIMSHTFPFNAVLTVMLRRAVDLYALLLLPSFHFVGEGGRRWG